MTFTKKLSPIALATSLAIGGMAAPVAANAAGSFSANVNVTSDYLFRGITQTYGEAAIQGGIDWDSGAGFYVGTWASNVGGTFIDNTATPAVSNDAENEVDIYAGYAGEAGGLSYDISYWLFRYTQEDFFPDYEELALGLGYGPVSFTFVQAFDVGFTPEDSPYYAIAYDGSISESVGFNITIGHWDLDNGADYTHYDATITKSFNDVWEMGFGVSDNNTDDDPAGNLNNDLTIVVNVGASFDL